MLFHIKCVLLWDTKCICCFIQSVFLYIRVVRVTNKFFTITYKMSVMLHTTCPCWCVQSVCTVTRCVTVITCKASFLLHTKWLYCHMMCRSHHMQSVHVLLTKCLYCHTMCHSLSHAKVSLLLHTKCLYCHTMCQSLSHAKCPCCCIQSDYTVTRCVKVYHMQSVLADAYKVSILSHDVSKFITCKVSLLLHTKWLCCHTMCRCHHMQSVLVVAYNVTILPHDVSLSSHAKCPCCIQSVYTVTRCVVVTCKVSLLHTKCLYCHAMCLSHHMQSVLVVAYKVSILSRVIVYHIQRVLAVAYKVTILPHDVS